MGIEMSEQPEKYCAVCGRRMVWRKKWRHNWDRVMYCSRACRKAGLNEGDQALETMIIDLLKRRGQGKTICPSEIARMAGGDTSNDPSKGAWRNLMPATRSAARRLAAKGIVDFLQGGRPVDPSRARGPVRIRLRSS